MKTQFSNKWKASVQPRKQRKYVYNAPDHIKSKMLGSNLSKDLRAKHNVRTVRPIKGDKVKVVRGQHKGKVGKIETLNIHSMRAQITGIESIKKDGNKSLIPIHVTNLQVLELVLTDKKRKAILERKSKK